MPLGSPIAPTIPLKGWVSFSTSRSSIAARPCTLFRHVISPSLPTLPPVQLRPLSLASSRQITTLLASLCRVGHSSRVIPTSTTRREPNVA